MKKRLLQFILIFILAVVIFSRLPLYVERTMVRLYRIDTASDEIQWGWRLRTLPDFLSSKATMARAQRPEVWLRINLLLACGYASLAALLADRALMRCSARRSVASSAPAAEPGRTANSYEGLLELYWEQGWEGRVEYSLFLEGLRHPLFLENGQRLTIYGEDGSVLWSGVVRFVPRKRREDHDLPYGIWSDMKQAGVSYAQWMAWFAHKPPLQAVVEIDEDSDAVRQ